MTKIAERIERELSLRGGDRLAQYDAGIADEEKGILNQLGMFSTEQLRRLMALKIERYVYGRLTAAAADLVRGLPGAHALSFCVNGCSKLAQDVIDDLERPRSLRGFEIESMRAAVRLAVEAYRYDVDKVMEPECERVRRSAISPVATPVASATPRADSVVDMVNWLGGLAEAMCAHLGPYGDDARAAGLVGLVLARLSAAAVAGRDDPRGVIAAVSDALIALHASEAQLIPGLKIRLTRRLCDKVAELAGHTRRYSRIKTAFDAASAGGKGHGCK